MAATSNMVRRSRPLKAKCKSPGRAQTEVNAVARPARGTWILHVDRQDVISILDKLPVGVAVLGSPNGNALYINDEIVKTLGYTLSETPSSTSLIKKAMPDRRARSEAHKEWMRIVKCGGGVPMVRPFVCGDGTVRFF
jgi:hypothetical protein